MKTTALMLGVSTLLLFLTFAFLRIFGSHPLVVGLLILMWTAGIAFVVMMAVYDAKLGNRPSVLPSFSSSPDVARQVREIQLYADSLAQTRMMADMHRMMTEHNLREQFNAFTKK